MSIKKRIKPGRIEPSSDGRAIVVHFTTEITHLDEDGQPTHVEKEPPDKKEVSVSKALRGLGPEQIPDLAQEIVQKCRYIPATKKREVEQVLAKLQQAMLPSTSRNGSPTHHDEGPERPQRGEDRPEKERKRREKRASNNGEDDCEQPQGRRNRSREKEGRGSVSGDGPWAGSNHSTPMELARPADLLPEASLDRIDDYADELYEEKMEMKAQGAQRLLRLCAEVRPLGEICEHSTLLGVLSRELRENAKRSHELAVAITGIFLCLAHFTQFHEALTRHQCNDVTMRVVEYESRRRAVLQKELDLARGRMVARGSQASAEDRSMLEREEKRYRGVLERQDRLLQLCLLMLRRLAEDPGVERKLVAQRICALLTPALSRNSEDLLVTALGFLHKLVVYEENKDQLVQSIDALVRLAELVGHPSLEVTHMALKVCFNLSFDPRARSTLATQTALLGKLRPAIQHGQTRKAALRLLYQLSTDGPLRPTLASRHPECVALALQLLARYPEEQGDDEMLTVALSINLAADESCAALMLESEIFPKTVHRAIRGGDELLLKVLRHVASHAGIRPKLITSMQEAGGSPRRAEWLHELVHLAISSSEDKPDILLEALGCLSGLDCTGAEVPWCELCQDGLLELLHRVLIVGFSEDDILLEAIMIVGTIALDPESTPHLVASKIPTLLPNLLTEKTQDAEILAQLLFTVRCLLLQEETREVLLHETDAPERILELLRPGVQSDLQMQAVQQAAEELVDLILQVDGQSGRESPWAPRIKAFRFEIHNADWCSRLRKPGARGPSPPDAVLSPGLPPRPGIDWPDLLEAKVPKMDARQSFMPWTDVGGLADRRWESLS